MIWWKRAGGGEYLKVVVAAEIGVEGGVFDHRSDPW